MPFMNRPCHLGILDISLGQDGNWRVAILPYGEVGKGESCLFCFGVSCGRIYIEVLYKWFWKF